MNISNGCRFQPDDKIDRLYQAFNEYLQENRQRIEDDIEQFEREAAKKGLLYAGRPLAIGCYPLLFSRAQIDDISGVVKASIQVMEKITRLFLQEPAIRKFFGFTPEQIELIEVDPGYKSAIPCGRFDSFFDGQNIRFTELNTDGTAGMDGAEKVAKLFLSLPSMQEFFSACPVRVFDIHHCVLQTILDCYRQFLNTPPAKPSCIAIVDWKEARTYAEFAAFEKFCREQGYEAVVADPREFEYNGGVLSHHGQKIDIIYRRVVSSEYMERLEELEPMTQAFKDHNVCIVGSFRSDVAFSKKVFAALHKPEFASFFSENERRLVERHIPWTQPFEDVECEYRDQKINMPELARRNRASFVLKPSNLYEGQGVWLGTQKNQGEWEELIRSALEEDYVLQELVPNPYMAVGTWEETFEMKERFIHLGEYVFGGDFCGLYGRIAEGPLIDRTSRERLVPCLVLAT